MDRVVLPHEVTVYSDEDLATAAQNDTETEATQMVVNVHVSNREISAKSTEVLESRLEELQEAPIER